ncbi:MAG: hypothetical protein JWN14_4126 [Chthonomonadales bacterium]|nr:hypothetical protein [Chthonomonadales bacterium]
MSNSPARSAGGSRRKTAATSLGLILLAGIVLIGFWWSASLRIPVLVIPTPIMPVPNARDSYIAAAKAVVGSKQIDDAVSSEPTMVYTRAQKEALIRQNAGAFNILHQGFADSYLNPPARSLTTFNPEYADFRHLTRVLAFQGQVRREAGDWSGAADSYLDALRLGQDIPHGSTMIGDLVGIACQAIGRRHLWEVVERLDTAHSRAATARLVAIIDGHISYADVLQEEKWSWQSNYLEMYGDKKRRNALGKSIIAAQGGENPIRDFVESLSFLIHPKSQVIAGFTTYMDAITAQARQPYAAKMPPPPLPSDPLNRIILPVMMDGRLKHVDGETQNGLLLVMLALHTFRLEQGRYPASLTELAPAYLKKLPDDPFALQGTFGYHLDGNRYLLYSVGPDGKDDGGKRIDDPKKAADPNPNARYYLEKNSVGDVVAGKSLW